MILKKLQIKAGNLDYTTNCYIVMDNDTKRAMVIDPAGDVNRIMKVLEYNKMSLDYIVLTHCHGDHIGGIKELMERTDAKIAIHIKDALGLKDESVNLAPYVGIENPNIDPDIFLEENDVITVGNLNFKIIHTPGHTKGSMCIYGNNALFSGDTLFRGTWGRTDLPSSSFEEIINSIEKKLIKLPDDTIVYPGHGKPTIISDEKKIYLELKPY